jgi:pyrophosphatase PpaX
VPLDAVSFDAVLFDLDGTLLDSVPLIFESFRHTFAACGDALPAPAELARAIGIPLRSFFVSLGKSEPEVEALIASYRAYNLEHHDARVSAFPGAVETVLDVRRRGLRTALVTSKNGATARRGLEVIGLAQEMDAVVTCDDVTRPKPDPEPVVRALERLGVLPRRAVFVGDSLHDLHAGRGAGVRTAAALWGPFSRADLESAQPDYWLDAPNELLKLLN